ncbi:MAG TPA: hypothetical protein V6C65_01740 [Allocoleopsis sp.]
MSYYNQLHPWCIIHCLPNAQTAIVARFRRRNDAEAHLRVLQQLTPTATYDLIFDVSESNQESGDRPNPFSSQPLSPSFSTIEMN